MSEEKFPEIETKLEVKLESEEKPVKLYLYGVIRQANAWDEPDSGLFISSKMVRDKLQEIGGKDIELHINTRGGDAFESIAIRNLIKSYEGKVNAYIDAMAGSGGSIIVTGADKVYMYESSQQFIHKAWTIALGNADYLMKVAADLEKLDSSLMKNYMANFVGTEEELRQLLADESQLTAEECLAFGLCHEIIKDEDLEGDEEEEAQTSIKETLFAKYGKDIKNKMEGDEGSQNKTTLFNALKQN